VPKENKRFINPLLRPSQDQPVQDNTAAPTSDVAPTQEEQNGRETTHSPITSSPAPLAPQTDVVDYTAGNMRNTHTAQVVNEPPLTPEPHTRVASAALPDSDGDKKTRPATTTGRSASRSSTARLTSGRNVEREEAAREAVRSYTHSNERGEDDEDRSQSYRRRAEVRFEHMHERLTVWIDRDLKRGLEDLASRRNLSKTALINEAMADLLKKHNAD
jgi:hypothetical protein